MRSIGSREILLSLCVAACGSDPAPAAVPRDAPVAPSGPSSPPPSPRSPSPPAAPDAGAPSAPPCASPPCAARPIVFVHGFTGSNDDFVPLLDALTTQDPRWSAYQSVGRAEHRDWARRAFDRKRWLFAFDYYLEKVKDGRGSYSAGPGRIGTNAADTCASPSGAGDIVPDDAAYDAGITHSYAQDLSEMIDDVLFATGSSKVDIVAHSMGGMVARSYLAFLGGDARVERVLLLASPVEGVGIEGLLEYFPVSHEPWMNDHEVAELDGGSFVSKIRFTLCGAAGSPGAFGTQLLAQEKAHPPGPELHVMSGDKDILISYASADHPLAVSHDVVPGADHSGILKAAMTLDHVRSVVGGTL